MPTKYKRHSFRGLLGDGAQDEIELERSNMNVAYRIVKFKVLPAQPTSSTTVSTVGVWRESQSSVVNTLDFSDPDLLAATMLTTTSNIAPFEGPVYFDNILFSRNIFISQQESSGNNYAINYYLELEEVPVGAATLMQLKLGVARKLNLKQSV